MESKQENNETINNNDQKIIDENAAAENIAFLELLLTDKNEKVTEYEKVKKIFKI